MNRHGRMGKRPHSHDYWGNWLLPWWLRRPARPLLLVSLLTAFNVVLSVFLMPGTSVWFLIGNLAWSACFYGMGYFAGVFHERHRRYKERREQLDTLDRLGGIHTEDRWH